jgi:Ca2+-transporting ATPase
MIRPLPSALGQEARPGTVGKERLRKMHRQNRLNQGARQAWAIFRLAARKFLRIDGTKWAGAFAFNAFFSLFPLMVLLVTISSAFIDRDRAATEVIAYVETFVPLSGDRKAYIFDTVAGVIKARGQAGAIAFLILVWVTLQCFTTLISATNHAWSIEGYSWWRLPLKSLMLLGITAAAVLLSIGAPMLAQMASDRLFLMNDLHPWVYSLLSFFIPLLVLFLGLSLFYRLAPRRPTRFSEVWVAALFATLLLLAAENLFVLYPKHFATLNAVYGAFGGIMALLLWIYLSGSIFIFGACLCAAQDEAHSAQADSIATRKTKGTEP